MNQRAGIGFLLIVVALVLQVVTRGVDDDAIRITVSGFSAALAILGFVMVWQARRTRR